MRMRRKPWARPELSACPYFVSLPPLYCGKWQSVFPNKAPLAVELGCGKGSFAAEFALRHPEYNLLAMDLKSEVLAVARRTVTEQFAQAGREVENLRLMAQDIERIDLVLSPEDKVERLYINFCNPWPRLKHKKRRLTHPRQLMKYRAFLKPGGEIWFKTDDMELFTESQEYFTSCGFALTRVSYDLAQEKGIDNIVTEHEKMFTAEGIPIKFLIARLEDK